MPKSAMKSGKHGPLFFTMEVACQWFHYRLFKMTLF
jgi:hypothetical protein